MFNSNLVNEKGVPVVLGLALAYGGIVPSWPGCGVSDGQHLRRRGVLLFGGFDLLLGARGPYAKQIGGDVGHAVGVYLWAWAIFTAYMTVAALRTSGAVLLVFALLTVTFVLLSIGAVGPHTTVTHWGGYIGLATAAAAWYASFAAVTNSTFGRTVLPVMPLSKR
jgi:succinate-acetate transporter protein